MLCTDGLVERRSEPLEVGLGRLRAAAEAWFDAAVSAQATAGLLQELLTPRRDGDVVLVVKHLVIDRSTV